MGYTAGVITTNTPVLARVSSQTIGDGILSSYIIDHNFGTRDVNVQIYDSLTYDSVFADVVRTSVNRITVSFANVPVENQTYRVVITG